MRKFYTGVVNHSKLILVVFAILFLVCALMKNFISVNYDMNDYLPPDSPSTIALDTMDEVYEGGIPNARVMVKDVSVAKALKYKAKLEAADGVSEVTWLDDSQDMNIPIEYMDEDSVETYYKDGVALYSVTIDEDKRIDACNAIREIIGDDNSMSGSAVSTAVATTSTVTEIPIIAAIGVLFTLIVLLLDNLVGRAIHRACRTRSCNCHKRWQQLDVWRNFVRNKRRGQHPSACSLA